jgi:exopolyphosphatase/guanosine-5'-triphosphate,3'-diphosphate pyrophosphatase
MAAPITPRWEWRTFGRRFGPAEAAFAALTPTGVQESDETYVLAPGGDTVKIRFELMDVKVLREVNADGLERWEPVLKSGFPVGPDDLRAVFEALKLAPPSLTEASYPLDQALDLLRAAGPVRVVGVHKRRVRYTVGGCTSEVSDVAADGWRTRTVAIESEDAEAVIAAVRSVGLGGHVNTSYPKGLMALLDQRPERYAVIDVGTNSVKFHIGELSEDGTWRRVVDRAELTRLGEGLEEGGAISAEAQERTLAAIEGMVEEARRHGVIAYAAVGTAGLRAARNRAEAAAAAKERTGLEIVVISGEEEGRLAYIAATAGLGVGDGSLVVFDTGGGSTQFTFGHGTRVDERFSVPVGAVRFTERFGLDGAVSPEVLGEAQAAIGAELDRLDGRPRPEALVGMGGALTNMAAVKHGLATYDPDVVQGTVLDLAAIDREIELYRSMDAESRRGIVGLQPKRAEVILAGACIVRAVMQKLGQDRLTVSDRGLRHGLLAERFGA